MYSQPPLSAGSAKLGWCIFEKKKNSRKFQKAKLEVAATSTIYIAFVCIYNVSYRIDITFSLYWAL